MRIAHALTIGLLASSTALAADPSCRETAGAQQSATYVAQCLEVSPATRPPCNAANPCALIVDEIKRGCSILREPLKRRPVPAAQGASEPEFCRSYLTD